MLERVIMLVMRVIMCLQTQCLASIALIQKDLKKLYELRDKNQQRNRQYCLGAEELCCVS